LRENIFNSHFLSIESLENYRREQFKKDHLFEVDRGQYLKEISRNESSLETTDGEERDPQSRDYAVW